MLVKDEADIIEFTIRHLMGQVDVVYVTDNMSLDPTADIAKRLQPEYGFDRIKVGWDEEVGYYQDAKTTDLARRAMLDEHEWVVPCDADEWWYSPGRESIKEFLAGLAPDVAFVTADLYNHLPTAIDPEQEPDPFKRIGWRQRSHGALGKVACRLRPELEIGMGNHSAWAPGTGMTVPGLVIRHFSWRTPEQYLRKIRNGEAAYAAAGAARAGFGDHWRAFEGKPDVAVTDHFNTWFHVVDPTADSTLIYDPAP